MMISRDLGIDHHVLDVNKVLKYRPILKLYYIKFWGIQYEIYCAIRIWCAIDISNIDTFYIVDFDIYMLTYRYFKPWDIIYSQAR